LIKLSECRFWLLLVVLKHLKCMLLLYIFCSCDYRIPRDQSTFTQEKCSGNTKMGWSPLINQRGESCDLATPTKKIICLFQVFF
jgi:hypothetical protein